MLLILVFQYIQEKHQQEETLRNLSQKYDVMQNDNYLKKQLLTKKTSECDRLNETLQQIKGLDLVFTEKKGCYHEKSSESLPNTGIEEILNLRLHNFPLLISPPKVLRLNTGLCYVLGSRSDRQLLICAS